MANQGTQQTAARDEVEDLQLVPMSVELEAELSEIEDMFAQIDRNLEATRAYSKRIADRA